MGCPKCADKGVVKNNDGKIVVCPDCVDSDRLIKSLQTTLENTAGNPNKVTQHNNVRSILTHLPQYPVMAVMEAYEHNMDQDFIELLKRVFNVRGLK